MHIHVDTEKLKVVPVLSLLLSNLLSSFPSYCYRRWTGTNIGPPKIVTGKSAIGYLMFRRNATIDLSRDHATIVDLSFELHKSCDSKAIHFWRKVWEHSVEQARARRCLWIATLLVWLFLICFESYYVKEGPKLSPDQVSQSWARQDVFETTHCCFCWEAFRANRPGSPPQDRVGSDGKSLLLFPCGHVCDKVRLVCSGVFESTTVPLADASHCDF